MAWRRLFSETTNPRNLDRSNSTLDFSVEFDAPKVPSGCSQTLKGDFTAHPSPWTT
jgi:hypothetical protein